MLNKNIEREVEKMGSRSREEGKEYVLKMTKEHDVRFIQLWFTDVLGQLKSVNISVDELEEAVTGDLWSVMSGTIWVGAADA